MEGQKDGKMEGQKDGYDSTEGRGSERQTDESLGEAFQTVVQELRGSCVANMRSHLYGGMVDEPDFLLLLWSTQDVQGPACGPDKFRTCMHPTLLVFLGL